MKIKWKSKDFGGNKMDKTFFASKAVWGGLLVCIGGIATAIGGFLNGTMDMATMINAVLPQLGLGLGIIGIRMPLK